VKTVSIRKILNKIINVTVRMLLNSSIKQNPGPQPGIFQPRQKDKVSEVTL